MVNFRKTTAASSCVTLVFRTYEIFESLYELLIDNHPLRPPLPWTLLPSNGLNKVYLLERENISCEAKASITSSVTPLPFLSHSAVKS